MSLAMPIRRPAMCVCEQGLSSAGSFLVLWLVARLLGPAEFGTFAAVWVVLQLGVAVSSAWVSTALSSLPANGGDRIAGACLRRLAGLLVLLAGAVPAAVWCTVPELRAWPGCAGVAAVLGVTLPTVEFLRRYLARQGRVEISAVVVGCRWGLAAMAIALWHVREGLSVSAALMALGAGDALAMLVAACLIRYRQADVAMHGDPLCIEQIQALARPVLVHHAITAADGILVALAIRRWIDSAAYGAYAAVGSLGGAVAVLVQLVDIHYAAALVRRGQAPDARQSWRLGVGVAAASAALAFACRHAVVQALLPGYVAYSLLLPLATAQAVLMVFKQVGVAQLRVAGRREVYYLHGAIRLAGTALAAAVAATSGSIVAVCGAITAVFFGQCLAVGWLAGRKPAGAGNRGLPSNGRWAKFCHPAGAASAIPRPGAHCPFGPGYRVFGYRGRPVLALPGGPRSLELAALGRYQPHTLRRAVFRKAIKAAVRLGLDRLAARNADPLPPPLDTFPLAAWLEHAQALLGQRDLRAMLVWPSDRRRRRVHVHLLRADGTPAAFAKIAPAPEPGAPFRAPLEAEAQALSAVEAIPGRGFHVPAVIGLGTFAGWQFLLLEPVPTHALPVPPRIDTFPASLVAQYGGPPVRLPDAAVRGLSWWSRWNAYLEPGCPLLGQLERSSNEPAWLCRVHGDLGPANMLRAGGELWIVDWEESVALGPALADAVSFYLGLRPGQCRKHPRRVLGDLATHFGCPAEGAKQDEIGLALAFLCGTGREDALALARAWPESQSALNRRAA